MNGCNSCDNLCEGRAPYPPAGSETPAPACPLQASMAERFARCLTIAAKKNADYTGGADPFRNFRNAELVGVPVARGILVRITDKLARISTLLDKPPAVVDEALTDSLDDAINYLAILGAWLEEQPRGGVNSRDCSPPGITMPYHRSKARFPATRKGVERAKVGRRARGSRHRGDPDSGICAGLWRQARRALHGRRHHVRSHS